MLGVACAVVVSINPFNGMFGIYSSISIKDV